MRTTKDRDSRRSRLAAQENPKRVTDGRRSRASLFASLVMGATLWIDGSVAVAESSFAARDVVTRGAIELGGAVGYARPPRQSALAHRPTGLRSLCCRASE